MRKKLNLQLFAVTMVADMQIPPTLFQNYIYEKTKVLTPLAQSGIFYTSTELDTLAGGSGLTFTIPFVNDLDGDATTMVDGGRLDTSKVTTKKMNGTRFVLEKAWQKTDLSSVLSGTDPLGNFLERAARYWARQEQKFALGLLGMMSTKLAATHVLDISSATAGADVISATAVLNAKQKLGDADADLSIMLMNSITRTELQKQNLIEVVENSDGKIMFERYLGYRIVSFDSIPYDTTTKVTSTYICGAGVLGRGEGYPTDLKTLEYDRDSLGASDFVISRRSLVMHPIGLSWKGTIPAEATFADYDLLTDATNWDKVFEDKKIPFITLKHKVTI